MIDIGAAPPAANVVFGGVAVSVVYVPSWMVMVPVLSVPPAADAVVIVWPCASWLTLTE